MADLISEIMGMASPAIIDKVAASFGISGAAATSLLGAAVPGVMGALINKGSTPGGAKDVLSQLANATPNLSSALVGGNIGSMATQGSSMLSSLIGNSGVSTLSNAIATNAGVPVAAGASIMGLASQMVMSGLSKYAAGLDGAGLSRLLLGQKESVQHMLPAGLGSILGMSGRAGVPNMAASVVRSATSSASSAASTAATNLRSEGSKAQVSMPDDGAGGMSWLKYAIPVAVIALGAWYFFGMRGTDDLHMAKPTATATTTTATPPAAANTMVADVDVSKNLTGALGDVSAALGGVTDVASAQAALPKLQSAGTTITTITGLADKFSPEQKASVAGLINNSLPGITAAAVKIESIAGVGDILKPVLDGLINSLGTMK